MSKRVKKLDLTKNILKIENVSQFIDNNLIQYNEDKFNIEFFEIMKEGYIEMSRINLELSELSFQEEIANINEYENWLCGV